MLEWLRFGAITLLILSALIMETVAVFGVNRFRYGLNRVHAAAIGDTLAAACVIVAAIVYVGFDFLSLKLMFVVSLMWMTSPISGHLISLLILKTDKRIHKETKIWDS